MISKTKCKLFSAEGRVMKRQEAEERLKKLRPGTEEYRQLELVLRVRDCAIVNIDSPRGAYKVSTFRQSEQLRGGFGSSEHVAIGKAVKLEEVSSNVVMEKGFTEVTFADIIALAGDFYGIYGEAISLPGGGDEAKKQRFINAFQTIVDASNSQLSNIIREIREECIAVQNSGLPHHCYSSNLMQKSAAISRYKPDVGDLLVDNSDHFSENAEEAYRIGHAYAIEVAKEAGERGVLKGLKGLEGAYALDAFACHFLTDLFAAGHVRNQRGVLETFFVELFKLLPHISDSRVAKSCAGLLTAAQHEKDGNEGLNVTNKNGDFWRAYGDGSFFSPKNNENKEKAIAAVQKSVEEVYKAYITKTVVKSKMSQLFPKVTLSNPLPLYKVDNEGLVLYINGEERRITTENYLEVIKSIKGIPHALKDLPGSYVSGFFLEMLESKGVVVPVFVRDFNVVVEKLAAPGLERITSFVWHVVGIATYRQVELHSNKTTEKIDELADIVNETYNSAKEILDCVLETSKKVEKSLWKLNFQKIENSIGIIRSVKHDFATKGKLNMEELKNACYGLQKSKARIGSILALNTVTGQNILELYRNQFLNEKSENERIIMTTQWFRRLIDYQRNALLLYCLFYAQWKGYNEKEIQRQVVGFNNSIRTQIKNNKEFIDGELLFCSPSYVDLQLEKTKVKQAIKWEEV